MSRIRERTIEHHLLAQCRAHGLLCLKFVSPARGGVPDRVLVSPGGTVFVEVKRPGEKPGKRQAAVHAKLRRYGAEVHVVDGLASVDQLVRELAGDTKDPAPNTSVCGALDRQHGDSR